MRVFVGSTSEAMDLVNHVAIGLDKANGGSSFKAVPWGERVFAPSSYTLQALIAQGRSCDFAVLLATSDDVTTSRGVTAPAPRDNILLEIGLFIGLIGLERTYIASPHGVELKLPSDLGGLNRVPYPIRDGDSPTAQARHIVSEISPWMHELGPRSVSAEPTTSAQPTTSTTSDNDARKQLMDVMTHLRNNTYAQRWILKEKNNVIRVRGPREQRLDSVILSEDPTEALIQLSHLDRTLRAHGVRVHNTVLGQSR